MAFDYRNRFVAFVDILGVSRFMQDEKSAERYARAVHDVIVGILAQEGFFAFDHLDGSRQVEFEFRRPASSKARITTVSDALVLSIPELSGANEVHGRNRPLQILSLLESVSDLQSSLAAVGLLSRGGIAFGPLVHRRDLVLGAGLVNAYRLESKRAVFPRTIVHEDVLNILLHDQIPKRIMGFRSRVAHAISRDADGEYYVNYFGFRPLSGGALYQKEVLADILAGRERDLENETDASVIRKLDWFYRYVETSLASYNDTHDYLHHNSGTEFDKRYPRIFENLRHMVDNYERHGFYKDPFDDDIAP